ncbi:YveK family protein [Peribacillus kribbensis]|uniref:YveK family protein n=1 Tax=Peribacillus kribbensis TaxID=356658 RepID=UPI0003F4C939|nr:Wzz/FepE/Etk N-terminal domain-containing protein [Peribacillus kribbensis]
MEETISLKDLFSVLRKRLNLIILITLTAVLASALVSYFVLTPVYQSTAQLLVNQKKTDNLYNNYNEVQTNLQLINTYNVIIKSPAILEKVKDELNLKSSVSELNGKITVGNEQNSQVVNVSVEDNDPKKAAEIANKTVEVFKRDVSKIMNVDNVSILTPAVLGDHVSPIKPKPMLNIAIALVIGLMAGISLAFLFEYLDNTIKNEQDIEKLLELPVLGAITNIGDIEKSRGRKPGKSA